MKRGKGLKKPSKTCLASFDQELGASMHQNREEGTIEAASNDAKLLISFGSSADILK